MSDKNNCHHPAYRDSLAKCLVVFDVSRLQFADDAGVSRETIREYLDEQSKPYERTMHKILTEMTKRGWIVSDGQHFPVPRTETINVEGKTFTVSELKALIASAK